jgi:hypothetical protein
VKILLLVVEGIREVGEVPARERTVRHQQRHRFGSWLPRAFCECFYSKRFCSMHSPVHISFSMPNTAHQLRQREYC